MSVESMAIALHHSRARGTARLILIGIANHDGDGGAWPAVATLAKYAGITDRRNVQRAIATLEQLGEIQRLVSAGGDHSMADYERPNLYRFLLDCPHDCDRSKQHRTRRRPAVIEGFPGEGAAVAPRGANPPRGGESAAGGGGGSAAQTIPITQPSIAVLEPTTEAHDERCPSRAKGHSYGPDDICIYCALHRDQYMVGSDIHWRN